MRNGGNLFLKSLLLAGMRVLAAGCALALTLVVAQRSVHDLGVFRTLFAYFIICEALPLLGLQTYLVREIAVRPATTRRYSLHALVFSAVVALLGAAILCGVSLLGGYSPAVQAGLFVVAAALPAMAASSVGYSVLIAAGKAESVGLLQGIETLVRTLIGVALIFAGFGVVTVIVVMVAARWLVLLGYWSRVRSSLGEGTWTWDGRALKELIQHLPAFAGITIMATVVRFAPQTMLPWMIGDAAAGQFAAAYVFIDVVLLIPTALMTNLGPVFARKANESSHALMASCRQGIKLLALGVMPMAAITMAIARPLFESVFPGSEAYAVSARILEIIIWVCCLQVVDLVLSVTTIAKGRQHIDFVAQTCGAAGIVGLMLLLVPRWGVIGAALSLVGGVSVILGTRLLLVREQLRGLGLVDALWRPCLACMAAVAAARAMDDHHWILSGLVGVVAYVTVLALCGAFKESEREETARFLQTGKA